MSKSGYKWHVFISYASEDKDAIAQPLAEALREKGLRVWYDEFSLRVGDNLRRAIDEGLSQSRFGVVILSSHFFSKDWPQKELDGLAARQIDGQTVILPLWYGVDAHDVRRYSPTLAGLVALRTEDGIPYMVNKLLEAMSPEVMIANATSEYVRDYEFLATFGDALDRMQGRKGRSRRVTAFAIAVARAMGLHPEQIAIIVQATFVHDIGKIYVPEVILRKPSKLTPQEIAVMRDHARLGYQKLRKFPFPAEAAKVVRSHRECFDGTGYPQGLRGKEIPIGARILSVADALDAMTSERPYRKAMSLQEAREEIEAWSGRQFDPGVVNAFSSVPEKVWKNLDDELRGNSLQAAGKDGGA